MAYNKGGLDTHSNRMEATFDKWMQRLDESEARMKAEYDSLRQRLLNSRAKILEQSASCAQIVSELEASSENAQAFLPDTGTCRNSDEIQRSDANDISCQVDDVSRNSNYVENVEVCRSSLERRLSEVSAPEILNAVQGLGLGESASALEVSSQRRLKVNSAPCVSSDKLKIGKLGAPEVRAVKGRLNVASAPSVCDDELRQGKLCAPKVSAVKGRLNVASAPTAEVRCKVVEKPEDEFSGHEVGWRHRGLISFVPKSGERRGVKLGRKGASSQKSGSQRSGKRLVSLITPNSGRQGRPEVSKVDTAQLVNQKVTNWFRCSGKK